MTGTTISWPAGSGAAGAGETALSLLLGAGFTLGLFLGVAHFENTAPAAPALAIEDLRVVALPLEPPPPRMVPAETAPAVTTMTGFDAAPSDSPVKIAVPPPELADLLPPPPARPAAVIEVGQLFANLKPKMDFAGTEQRIFQSSEVDQVPKVLYTVMPEVTRRMLKNQPAVRVTVILVIDANGAVLSTTLAESSGIPELDAVMLANIKEWTFSPAVKKGKRVKCLIQQGYAIRLPAASRFNTE